MKTKNMKVLYSYRSVPNTHYSGKSDIRNPKISMEGKWLETLGFHVGDKIQVTCDDGSIHITRMPEPAMVCETSEPYAK